MAKQKLESKLGATYRLRPSEVLEGGRVIFKRRREGIDGSQWRRAWKDALVHSRQRSGRLLQRRHRLLQCSGGVPAGTVKKPDRGCQVDVIDGRAFRRSASTFL